MYEQIVEFFRSNQFASGGLVLGVFSLLVVWGRSSGQVFLRRLRRMCVAEVEMSSDDCSFALDAVRVAAVRLGANRSGRIRLSYSPRKLAAGESDFASAKGDQLVPALSTGWHVISPEHGGRILVHFARTPATPQTAPRSDVRLIAWGPGRWGRIARFVREATERMRESPEIPIVVGTAQGWRNCGSQAGRPADSIVLPGDMFDEILADAARFFGRSSWYLERGIPWRRSFLFAGPPGSGKTSASLAIAGSLRFPIYTVSLSDSNLTDGLLAGLMADMNTPAVLVLEDIDCVLPSRESPEKGVSLAGVLGAIDGLFAPQGRLVVMTTNHPETLDPALLRRGRVDRRVDFSLATVEQASRLFLRFFPDAAVGLAEEFGLIAGSRPMCMVQHHLMMHADASPRDAVLAEWESWEEPALLITPRGVGPGIPPATARLMQFDPLPQLSTRG